METDKEDIHRSICLQYCAKKLEQGIKIDPDTVDLILYMNDPVLQQIMADKFIVSTPYTASSKQVVDYEDTGTNTPFYNKLRSQFITRKKQLGVIIDSDCDLSLYSDDPVLKDIISQYEVQNSENYTYFCLPNWLLRLFRTVASFFM